MDEGQRTYYLIAGERSGDLHGANLIKALRKSDPGAGFRAWGGDSMKKAGAELVTHYDKMAFMGIWEVLRNLFKIRALLNSCKKDLLEVRPDVLILIDYPGFNLRMAKFAHQNDIRVFYYISPKIWAWNRKRAYKIKKFVERMFVILPFEEEFYQSYDYKVDYVGNPLMDAINSFTPEADFKEKHHLNQKPVIAILPGSRKQEIENMLQLMIEVSREYEQYQFVVAGVSNLDPSFYTAVKDVPGLMLVFDKTYDLLSIAHAALVTSGTAALETALFNVPQVVCYKTSWLSYVIGRRLVKIDYISLVNLIAGKEVVRELLQGDFNRNELNSELLRISQDDETRKQQFRDYETIRKMLSQDSPSEKTARLMLQYLND